jgi:hypothetical protein
MHIGSSKGEGNSQRTRFRRVESLGGQERVRKVLVCTEVRAGQEL